MLGASTVGPYGLLCTSVKGVGGCYTLAVNVEMGPVFHSHCTQNACVYSVPPAFIPPFNLPLFPSPINDSFVQVFLSWWAHWPQQGRVQRLVTLLKPTDFCVVFHLL